MNTIFFLYKIIWSSRIKQWLKPGQLFEGSKYKVCRRRVFWLIPSQNSKQILYSLQYLWFQF